MTMHARDANGDWLPAAVPSACLSGADAVTQLVRDRLKLFTGEWWEDPELGNPILEALRSRRVTEADLSRIASELVTFIRESDQVVSVAEVQISMKARKINFSCQILTAYGTVSNVTVTG